MSFPEQLLYQLAGIIDLPHGCNGVCAVMRTNHQRLGLIVGDTSDTHISLHGIYIFIEFGAERGILDIVYRPVIPVLLTVYRHSGTSGSQVGMIIRSKKQIKHAIFLGCYSKKSTHSNSPIQLPLAAICSVSSLQCPCKGSTSPFVREVPAP